MKKRVVLVGIIAFLTGSGGALALWALGYPATVVGGQFTTETVFPHQSLNVSIPTAGRSLYLTYNTSNDRAVILSINNSPAFPTELGVQAIFSTGINSYSTITFRIENNYTHGIHVNYDCPPPAPPAPPTGYCTRILSPGQNVSTTIGVASAGGKFPFFYTTSTGEALKVFANNTSIPSYKRYSMNYDSRTIPVTVLSFKNNSSQPVGVTFIYYAFPVNRQDWTLVVQGAFLGLAGAGAGTAALGILNRRKNPQLQR